MTQAMRAERPRKMTFEEFLDWADEDTYAEWVDGDVVYMSPSSARHIDIAGFLQAVVRVFAETHHSGRVLGDTFLMRLAQRPAGRMPDVIFVASDNLRRIEKTYLDGPADLAVEIISPDDPDRDRVDKYGEYERGGVREYWLIDPENRRADFYLLDETGRYRPLPVDGGVFRSEALQGLWLKVDWLWQEPTPTVLSVLKEWGMV